MKKALGLFICLLIFFAFSYADDRRLSDNSGLYSVQVDGKWGFINAKGEKLQIKKIVHNNLSIRYSMSGIREVSIQKGHLIYTDSEYRGKDPRAAGNPDDYARMGSEVPVAGSEIESLMKVIQTSGFFDLKDTYGTSQDDRHYPVRITIESSTINKSVLYRSHPSYPAPAAFQKVEEAILRFARGKIHKTSQLEANSPSSSAN